jgi:hypothetical protein
MKTLVFCLMLLACLGSNSTTDEKHQLPINPSALSGILIVLMLLVVLSIGLGALWGIEGPTTYSTVPLLVGKDK